MIVEITPRKLKGEINAIASKSVAHRALICASLATGESEISIGTTSLDIEATKSALRSMGAGIEENENVCRITPVKDNGEAFVDCNESGSTLRFLVSVCASLGKKATFTGRGRLPERPMKTLTDELKNHGITVNEGFPIEIEGKLQRGVYTLDGSVSSQFVTGLLMALPQAGGGEIHLTGTVQSKSYIDITLSVMEKFGVKVEEKGNTYIVPDKRFSPAKLTVEGDWSNAAFFLSAGVKMNNLDMNSKQGDKKVAEILERLENEKGKITIDVSDIPDLVPILAVKASTRKDTTEFINAERLKIKESDRILSTVTMINSLGGKAEGTDNSIKIYGMGAFKGGKVSAFNDHRIVMSAAIAAAYSEGNVIIDGAEAVNKSYPHFFEDYKKLGGILNVL
ncbi:MAG: 3-phosphoshikimate 1-carboxyvinyltransferase [Clostridia bacterium]|nr:3-phosphoshikimate 1-carboxyvinyltransferase [Clostridia bacterium]